MRVDPIRISRHRRSSASRNPERPVVPPPQLSQPELVPCPVGESSMAPGATTPSALSSLKAYFSKVGNVISPISFQPVRSPLSNPLHPLDLVIPRFPWTEEENRVRSQLCSNGLALQLMGPESADPVSWVNKQHLTSQIRTSDVADQFPALTVFGSCHRPHFNLRGRLQMPGPKSEDFLSGQALPRFNVSRPFSCLVKTRSQGKSAASPVETGSG